MAMANGSDIVDDTASAATVPRPGQQKRVRVHLKPMKRQNEQSSIQFPYMDLDTSVSVAQAILSTGGVPVSRDQLAGVMNSTSGSGTFLVKISAARMFGLIAHAQGKYELTLLGFSILESDEARQKAARAEAFLNVPLYRRVYEEFKGKQLPPRPKGLQQAFVKFGVSSKQAYNARLAFDKSATQAGFFSAGPERLIEPIIGGATGPTGPTGPAGPSGPTGPTGPSRSELIGLKLPSRAQRFAGGDGDLDLDPLIQGLLRRLPKSGDAWGADKRARWLQTLAANFEMVYESEGNNKVIIIECKDATTPS